MWQCVVLWKFENCISFTPTTIQTRYVIENKSWHFCTHFTATTVTHSGFIRNVRYTYITNSTQVEIMTTKYVLMIIVIGFDDYVFFFGVWFIRLHINHGQAATNNVIFTNVCGNGKDCHPVHLTIFSREWESHAMVYFKCGVQPKCRVQDGKCGVQNWKM